MINNDKFYETFGVHMEAGASLCDICECNRPCKECRLYGRNYDYNQYIAPKEDLGIKSPSKLYNGELNNIKQFTSIKESLLDSLSKESDLIVATAYSYAKNLTLYGVDATKVWNTVIENSYNMEQVYRKGYMDGQRAHSEDVIERIRRYSETLKRNEEKEDKKNDN